MAGAHAKKVMPHFFSGLIAFGLAAAVLFAGGMVVIHLEHTTLPSTAPELFPLKNQGLAFQRVAAQASDVLPLYGGSEVTFPPVPELASQFFRTAPTGFQVSPVGHGGTTSLIVLQKVSALGSDLRGKKLAISLEPGFFLLGDPARSDAYKANFSLIAASEMAFSTALDFKLKRAIASRMLESPSTLEKSPLLEFALRRLASGRRLDRVVFCALWPVGKAQTALLVLQDHFAAFNYIRHEIKPAPRCHSEILDWPKLIAKVGRSSTTEVDKIKKRLSMVAQIPPGGGDAAFRLQMNVGLGWTDLELLLRALAEIHAQPLILSMPMDGRFYDQIGVSRSARESYYQKIRTIVQRYNFAVVEFEGHDEDPAFFHPYMQPVPSRHLTAQSWMLYNRALDDFFHDRTPKG
jgi:D-alanine transfer protein